MDDQNINYKTRNIMEGIMSLHEILHETKRRKEVGIILKLDFEKAYDKVNWNFLFDCLLHWGFLPYLVQLDQASGDWWDCLCET